MQLRKVLCVCFGNTCRSPMLEGLLRHHLNGKEIVVESAGVLDKKDGAGANPHSITCMQERDINITNHRRRYAGDLDLTAYDRFYVTGADIRDELLKLGVSADRIEILCENTGGVPNPFNNDLPMDGQDMAKYIPCAAVLEAEARRIASSL